MPTSGVEPGRERRSPHAYGALAGFARQRCRQARPRSRGRNHVSPTSPLLSEADLAGGTSRFPAALPRSQARGWPMSLLSVESIDSHHGLLQAVRQVSLELEEGETLALVGANGAGKTTLLRTIAGAHRPAAGRVVFEGRDITSVPAYRRVRSGITLVPEGRRLFTGLTVEENLTLAARAGRPGRWTVDAVIDVFPMLGPLRRKRAGS